MSQTNLADLLARAATVACDVYRDPRDADALDELQNALTEAMSEVQSLRERAVNPVDLRFLSPVPAGYDTVLGYLAKHNPGLLSMIDQVPEATARDGYWLKHRAAEEGHKVLKVDACAWLRSQGIEQVNAYPIRLLIRRLGI